MKNALSEMMFWVKWILLLTVALLVVMIAVAELLPDAQPVAGYVVGVIFMAAGFLLVARRAKQKQPARYDAIRTLLSRDAGVRRAQARLALCVVIGFGGVVLLDSVLPSGWLVPTVVAVSGGTFVWARVANRRAVERQQPVERRPPMT